MSEQINKVLASTSQAFSTGEQKQARDNIGAQASGDYAYNSAVSSKADSSSLSSYVPFSAISADANSAITSINGSSVGAGFDGCSANNCISGSGTSGSPLGLSSEVELYRNNPYGSRTYASAGHITVSANAYASVRVYQDESSYVNMSPTGLYIMHTASGVGGNSIHSTYGDTFNLNYNAGEYWLRHVYTDASGIRASYNGNTSAIAIYGFGKALFTDDSGATWEAVNPSSIRKWNSGVSATWNESANSLGTGFGGNGAVSASQYNYGGAYDNWACREVYADGIPAQQLYGFQTPPASGSSEYVINGNGHFVSHRNPYECHVFNLTGDLCNYDWEQDSAYPTGLPYDMRIDFMVYGTGNGYVLINLDAAGTTADVRTGESATMFYDHTASAWIGQVGNHNIG